MSPDNFTVLEIGSGSFKLFREGHFNERYESSLGRGLSPDGALASDSISISLSNLKDNIIPFLKTQGIKLEDVLVFATAAIRRAVNDPNKSGQKFIKALEDLGFNGIRVFSEKEEAVYASMGALEDHPEIRNVGILDTGGASHQLTEVKDGKILKTVSVPLGSHSDLDAAERPDFIKMGFSPQRTLVTIGTTGKILNSVPNVNLEQLLEIEKSMQLMTIEERKEHLRKLIPNKDIHKLFVDYRIAILSNSFKIIINAAQNLGTKEFLPSKQAAKNFISKHGFCL